MSGGKDFVDEVVDVSDATSPGFAASVDEALAGRIALRDFLLGRLVRLQDTYPEEHPERYGVTPKTLRRLAADHGGEIPVGHGDVTYTPFGRRPWRSETGLCGNCQHRKDSTERGGPGVPRFQCTAGHGDVVLCYCWKLRSDVEPDGGSEGAP